MTSLSAWVKKKNRSARRHGNDGNVAAQDGEIEFIASEPGSITWSISKLPDGFTSEDATEDDSMFKIKIADVMAQTVKRFPVSVTAKNGAGSEVITVDLADGDKVKIADIELPSGIHKVGDSVDNDGTADIAINAPDNDGNAPVFTITLRINGASKPVTKVCKVGVTGASPIIKNSDGVEASKDITVEDAAGNTIADIVFTAKNWLTAKIEDDGSLKISRKVTMMCLVAPEISSQGTVLTKEIELGKMIKLQARRERLKDYNVVACRRGYSEYLE